MFKDGGVILGKYSRDQANINPPLAWANIPAGTKSFAIIMEDPDVPRAAGVSVWDHWVVFNIPPTVTQIPEGWKVVGVKGAGRAANWTTPAPPARSRTPLHFHGLRARRHAVVTRGRDQKRCPCRNGRPYHC